MEAGRGRNVASGDQYDHLFPKAKGLDITVKGNASVEDTLKLIRKTVPLTLKDTEQLAAVLKGKNLYETCRNIWEFVYHHIQYKKDEKGIEQVRRPARAWKDRATGVDCDCYTEFISSILSNLGIPHVLRITKYSTDHYQHIYPIVPVDGNVNAALTDTKEYITIDCVKDEFDSEQPYSAKKDYPMRLDYLNGFDDGGHDSVDIGDLSATMDNQELNSRFGNFLKKATNTVKRTVSNTVKKVADKAGQGLRFVNRYTNPGTILLRNGFLLAMKINLFKVAEKLRYAYLTDAQATALNMDIGALNKIRTIKDRAETIYWQAGGLKENLKKGILGGKGNKDGKVPLNGLDGFGNAYADEQEYHLLNGNYENVEGLGDLGDPASGTAIAAATSAVSAIAAALSQVKGLFKGNPSGNAEPAPESSSSDTTSYTSEDTSTENYSDTPSVIQTSALTSRTSGARTLPGRSSPYSGQMDLSPLSPSPPPSLAPQTAQSVSSEGFLSKSTTWVKSNPIPAILLAGAVIGGGYLITRKKKKKPTRAKSMNGVSKKKGKGKVKTIHF